MTIFFSPFHLLLAFLSCLLLFFSSPHFLPSSISLYRTCSPPFTLSLTFRGTWWKSNHPTELVSLFFLFYLHHAIGCVCVPVCVAMFASLLTSAGWSFSQPLHPASLSVCLVCACQELLAARLKQFWPWKSPSLSFKSLISLFVCVCENKEVCMWVSSG